MGQQTVLVGAETEQVVGLPHPLHRRTGWGEFGAVLEGRELVFGVKIFVAEGIEPFVVAKIDVATDGQALPEGDGTGLVAGGQSCE